MQFAFKGYEMTSNQERFTIIIIIIMCTATAALKWNETFDKITKKTGEKKLSQLSFVKTGKWCNVLESFVWKCRMKNEEYIFLYHISTQ